MPSTIQIALLVEILVNIPIATFLLFTPTRVLTHLVSNATSLAGVPSSTTTVTQFIGILFFAITVPLVLSLPNGPHAVEVRKVTYYLNGVGEALLIPWLLLKDAGSVSGFGTGILKQGAYQIIPLLAWRVFVLLVKPEWLNGGTKVERRKL
jgi:hypothetical protein